MTLSIQYFSGHNEPTIMKTTTASTTKSDVGYYGSNTYMTTENKLIKKA